MDISATAWTGAAAHADATEQAPTTLTHQVLLEPFTYISSNPGKEIRSLLIDAFDLWLEVPQGDLEVITRVVRMLHNASLLWVPHSLARVASGQSIGALE
jgi:hypothetical protein